MTDKEKWDTAIVAVTTEYSELPAAVREQLVPLLGKIREAKELVHSWAEGLNGGEICASCGGQCCATGKHHFTVVDLLSHLVHGVKLPSPQFDSGCCPYLGDHGCVMAPGLRPYNCITFNCDRIDGLLESFERERFAAAERELRSCYESCDALFDNRFMYGMLINCERDLLRDRGRILRPH